MNLTFDSPKEHAWPDDEVSLGFAITNPAARRLPCAYRLEGPDNETISWRIDAPASVGPGERARGELHIRAPKNHGSHPITLAMRFRVSTDDPGVQAQATCTLIVRPAGFAVRPTLARGPGRSLVARLSLLRNGRSKVDAEVKFGLESGWRLYAGRPSVTVLSSGPRRRLTPRARWSAPRITLNPDGTVTVKMSLVNYGDLDVSASIRLRPGEGWWLVPDDPALTLKAQHGPLDVSATFRAPPGRRVGSTEELSVEIHVNGAPIAETKVPLRRAPAQLAQVVAFGAAAAIMVTGTAAAVDRTTDTATTTSTTSTSMAVEASTTTAPPPPTTATTVPLPTSTIASPPPDLCPNLRGDQPDVPSGLAVDADGNCVPAVQPCNASVQSGGEGILATLHDLREPGPLSFRFTYETFSIGDTIIIRYEDQEVFRVDEVATEGTVSKIVDLPPGTSTHVEVTVIGPPGTTEWSYTVDCPSGE